MKKLFIITLAVMLVGMVASVYAEGMYTRDPSFTVKTEVEDSMGQTLSSNIVAGNKVMGLTLSDSAATHIGLYDAAAVSTSAQPSNNFAEVYCAAGTAETVMFPFPRKLSNGLVYSLTAATGAVTVYYE